MTPFFILPSTTQTTTKRNPSFAFFLLFSSCLNIFSFIHKSILGLSDRVNNTKFDIVRHLSMVIYILFEGLLLFYLQFFFNRTSLGARDIVRIKFIPKPSSNQILNLNFFSHFLLYHKLSAHRKSRKFPILPSWKKK